MKRNIICRFFMVSLIIIIACIAAFRITSESIKNDNETYNINSGWFFYENGIKKQVSLPTHIRTYNNTLTLFHECVNDLKPYNVISTKAAMYNLKLYCGDDLIYEFDGDKREINSAVRNNIVCSAPLPEDSRNKIIKAEYVSKNGIYNLSEFTVSREKTLIKKIFFKSFFGLIVAVAMIVIGFLAMLFGIVLVFEKKDDMRVLCIAVFLVICGLWCLSDSPFIFYIFNYSTIIFNIDFYLFMAMPIPIFYFVLYTGDMKKYKALKSLRFLYYINIIVQSLFAISGIFTFFKMLYVTHILMIVIGVIIPVCILVRDYKQKKQSDNLMCIKILLAVGALGIIAILLYVFFGFAAYQLIFQTGLLLLMAVLLNRLLRDFIESVKSRAELMFYKRLSEEDKLTKLENRRAFDILIEKIDSQAIKYSNATMLFMDVNYLKETNDTLGHSAGDELLINAGKCIKKAFGILGYCYRVGGDEFCAILFNTSNTPQELYMRLKTEQDYINSNVDKQAELSIAFGCSSIIENGIKKTIEQWKNDADAKMYEHKKQIKLPRCKIVGKRD